MIWSKITNAADRMEQARTKLFTQRNAQFWGTLGLSLGLVDECKRILRNAAMVASDKIDTMATDAVSIFYNADFVMQLSEAECMTVIAHEISHCALGHFKRQGTREGHTWNMACDYELNLDLQKAGFVFPTGEFAPLLDTRFEGLSAEQIYSVISKENRQDEKAGQEPRHQPGSGDMQTPCGEDGLPMDGEAQAALHDAWEQRTAQTLGAARKAGKMAGGEVPSSLVAISNTLNTPSLIDWRQPLRAFIDNLGSRYATWSKFSRRGNSRGLALPGQKVIRPSCVAFIIDISGSMDSDKVGQALIEAQSALDDMACDAIDIIYTDTRVHDIDHYEIGDQIDFKDATKGGTNFEAVMNHIADLDMPYAAIVFLTDGQTSSWGCEPDCPVLWAITDTLPATEKLNPPYGDKLCLYTS
jgi:predicted metal-dependent peptidase